MSSDRIAVSAQGLSKRYRIRRQVQRATSFVEAVRDGLRFWNRTREEEFWALKDASFDIRQGEVLGIIGHNGAGKSTLLKILSRVIEPTEGQVRIRGRLGSLLEVGTGFHPELTGRENIFLNGAILGMRRQDVQRRFDEIVDFAGVERFLDTPVKRYSSGMYVRLAFAVAAHLEADVLIMDEVLAVGDESFQRKCLQKLGDVVGQGRTILFVSHNMSAISALTQRCMLLERGSIVFDGATEMAIERYLAGSAGPGQSSYTAAADPSRPTITRVELTTSHPGNVQGHGAPMRVGIEFETPFAIKGARVTVSVRDRLGRFATQSWMHDSERPLGRAPGRYQIDLEWPSVHLAPGDYTLNVSLAEYFGGVTFQRLEQICPFEVQVFGRTREGGWEKNVFAFFEEAEWTVVSHADALQSRASQGVGS